MAPKQKSEGAGGTGELLVSIEQYTRTRDAVIISLTSLQSSLAHVQSSVNELLRTYMQHTSSILAGEDADLDKLQLPPSITATANAAMEAATTAVSGISQAVNAPTQAETAAADGKNKKRKREKKEKDPNAPKKPLTAAFLYAQTARPIVRADLEAALAPGQILEKNAVNLETNKRWNELPEEEKEKWKASYRSSMEEYKVEMAEYLAKAGGKVADVHLDEDISDEGEVEIADVAAIDSDASSEDEDETPVTKAPSPPAKTPRPNKRQKTAQTPAVNGALASITPATTSTPVPVPGSSRPSTQVPAPNSSVEGPATAKKDKKKKEKAGSAAPQAIAPAPASAPKEATPEEGSRTSKKSKPSRSTRNAEVEVDKENAATPSQDKEKKKRDRSKRKSEAAA
ncbi:hypothetical protein EK21DRAFT_109400 [Setomelanomma holmii]|uniref:HMG box domain-containing protein n=1 Tax=Setomelanomma holmii TaxID=210430 RepID=A0A9P4HG21_9PLEO|nr:hypothetical protein EK21DRAFT_109400 [Setomelanomma holmii]